MKKVVVSIIIFLVLIQFIRPKKNISQTEIANSTIVMQMPNKVKTILKTSCADCHSNNTKYPWYSEIAPISWYLAQHVNKGKEHLNFSEWNAYNTNQKTHIIKDLKEVLKEHKMPLKSYLILHKESKLTNNQYKILSDWVKTIKAN